MATSYTSLLGFALPVTGELDGTWGDVVNNSITQLVEDSVAGAATASVASGDWTLTTTGSGASNQARCAILIPTGSPGVSRNIIAPSQSKAYIVVNQSNASVVVKGSATTGATVLAGQAALVAWNGSDFVAVSSGDVDGPASATDNAVARFDGTTGKLIQSSNVTISDGGVLTASGIVTTTFAASGAATIAGTLGVSGNTTLGGDLSVSGDISVTGSGTFAAEVDFGSIVNVSGVTNLGSDLNVSGDISVTGSGTFASEVDFLGPINVSGNTYVGGNLTVSGDSKFSGTLSVAETLGVSGITTLGSDLNVSGDISVTGSGTFAAEVDFLGPVNVSGNVALGRDLSVSGDISVTGSGTFAAEVDFLGPINVSGVAAFGSNVSVSGTLSVTRSGTFATEVDFGGPITVSGIADINNTLYVNEAVELVNVLTSTPASGTINIDFLNGGVVYYGTATSNFSLNVRGNATTTLNTVLATGEAAGMTVLIPQGGTSGYAQTNILIDGVTGVPLWQGGSGTFSVSGIDVIGLEIIKVGSGSYTILESVTKFKS